MSALLISGLRRPLTLGLGDPTAAPPADLPDDLVEALIARWRSWIAQGTPDDDVADLAQTADNGVWIAEAPTSAPLPVAVVDELSRVLDAETFDRRSTGHTRVYTGRIQLRVHDASRAAARRAALAIATDWESATAAGLILFDEGTLIDFGRSGPLLSPIDPDLGEDGQPVWTALIEFYFLLVETT